MTLKWRRSNSGLSDNFEIYTPEDELLAVFSFRGFLNDAQLEYNKKSYLFKSVKKFYQIWSDNRLIGSSKASRNEVEINSKYYSLNRISMTWLNSGNEIIASVDSPSKKSPIYGFFNLKDNQGDYLDPLLLCVYDLFTERIKKLNVLMVSLAIGGFIFAVMTALYLLR